MSQTSSLKGSQRHLRIKFGGGNISLICLSYLVMSHQLSPSLSLSDSLQ